MQGFAFCVHMGYWRQHLGLLTLEAKSTSRWNSNRTCTSGAPAAWSLHSTVPSSQTMPPFTASSVTAQVPLMLVASRAVTSFMTNGLLNILVPFLSVIQANYSNKEFQSEMQSLCYKPGSWEGGDLGVIWQIKANLSTSDMCPFDRATHNCLDNKALILCCWRMQKCSLKSREVFVEHRSLQHLPNRTNQTVGFQIKELLNKWWLDICSWLLMQKKVYF